MVRLIASIVLLMAASAAAPVVAGPQVWQEHGATSGVIRCESNDGRVRECPTGGARVMLVRQLSRSACIEGRSWGYGRSSVWVAQGCRAEFRLADGYGGSGGYYGGDAYGTPYGSPYGNQYGNQYGQYGNQYGGSYGNNAYGNAYGQGQVFRCESNDGRVRRCALQANPRDVQLVRQLSRSACIEGQTWGRERRGVWVAQGCRAEFSASRSGYGYGYGGDDRYARAYSGYGNVFRCESNDGRTRECAANTRAGVQLVRQLSNATCIQGRTWGYGRNGIWVSQGCRAEFRSY